MKTVFNHIKQHKVLYLLLLVFGLIYSSISLVNHYLMRTAALDLGMFNHALYCFAHFKANYFTLDLIGRELSYFGDHFSPITMLYAPFYYLFGTYTLLVVQIASILFGAIGAYKLSGLYIQNPTTRVLIAAHFLSIWGIYFALSYDFHNNVVAAMFIPWFAYHYFRGEKKWQILYFILILIAKENMALWMLFVLFGLAIIERKKGIRQLLKWEGLLMGISFIYFYVVVYQLMPAIAGTESTEQLYRYEAVGKSLSDIVGRVFSEPKYIFALLFEDPNGEKFNFGLKSELHFMVLVSGGFLLFRKPVFLLMLVPIYAQKFLSSIPSLWGIGSQYSIEFVPILSMVVIAVMAEVKSAKRQVIFSSLILFSTIFFTVDSIEKNATHWYTRTKTAFYDAKHYRTPIKVKEVKQAIRSIPEKAIVSSGTELSPYLAFRDKIYHFPNVKDASHIALLKNHGSSYPMSREDYEKRIDELRADSTWKVLRETTDVVVFYKEE